MSYCKFKHVYFNAIDGKIVENQMGEKLLVSKDVETTKCWNCGKELVYDENENADFEYDDFGEAVCYYCEDEVVKCEDCGRFVHDNDSCLVYRDGYERYVCESCLDGNYRRCDDCGEYHYRSEVRHTADEYYLCDDCAENHYFCPECGDLYYSNDYFQEWNGEWICETCYEEREEEERNYDIHNYSYKPVPIFLKTFGEETNEYFGFEIEAEGDKDYAEEFLGIMESRNNELLYLKEDSSVDGFEIVTQPMTRKYIYNDFTEKMKPGLRLLLNEGFRGHNRAGIHIHVSKDAITKEMLKKLIILLYPRTEKEIHTWLAITQRRRGDLNCWCSMNYGDLQGAGKKYTLKIIDENGKHTKTNSRRHTALNTENKNTIEFRIFNSNLRIERILKNAEVVFSLLDFTKTDRLPHLNNYLRFVRENRCKYVYLDAFLEERKVYKQPEKEKTKQEILKIVNHSTDEAITQENLIAYVRNLLDVEVNNTDNSENERGEETCASPF